MSMLASNILVPDNYTTTGCRGRGQFQLLDFNVQGYDHLWEIALLTLYAFYGHITPKTSDCALSELSNVVLSV